MFADLAIKTEPRSLFTFILSLSVKPKDGVRFPAKPNITLGICENIFYAQLLIKYL